MRSILLFVTAIRVVTELAAVPGVFTVLARRVARWGRGHAWLLWLLVVALAAVSTVFLSLDTTAVLLTPVVIALARHARLDPVPFALTTVWMANAGSLLLPVSNLTNLLAQHAMRDLNPIAFLSLTWAAAAVAMTIPMVTVFVVFQQSMRMRYEDAGGEAPADRMLCGACAAVLAVLLPLLVSGLQVWMPATAAAIVMGALFLVRQRLVVRLGLVPWRLLLLAAGLFLFVEALHAAGLGAVMTRIAGQGESPLALICLAITGTISSNAIDNLPACLALEPTTGTPVRVAALLIGVNAGSLITPWASLATLLWHQRLVAHGIELRWRRYLLLGAVVAPVTVVAATLALAATTWSP